MLLLVWMRGRDVNREVVWYGWMITEREGLGRWGK